MAQLRFRNTNERITSQEQIKALFDGLGAVYERWDTAKLPEAIRGRFLLSEEDKQAVLASYDAEIRELSGRRGYRSWDAIALSDETPQIEEQLKKFEQIHIHPEDELRAIVAGSGVFVVKGPGDAGYIDVEVEAGDVLSVPKGTPHFFTLQADRRVVAVRLFVGEDGWIAEPVEDPSYQAGA
jgi:1,2-dihydroxy-3-keto-5-methylthiopentene dioxygenase